MVRAERQRLISFHLSGVTVNNSIGSLAQLADAMWFGDAIRDHVADQYIDSSRFTSSGPHHGK